MYLPLLAVIGAAAAVLAVLAWPHRSRRGFSHFFAMEVARRGGCSAISGSSSIRPLRGGGSLRSSRQEAEAVARRLPASLFAFDESSATTLRFSTGWAIAGRPEAWDATLREADAMLYRQKRALR